MNNQNKETHHQLLAECTNGYISTCTCCREYNLVYNNIVLSFELDELLRFGDWLINFRYHEDTYLALPHGRCRVYRSPLSNLYIVFSQHELDEIEVLLAQTKLMLEARQILFMNIPPASSPE